MIRTLLWWTCLPLPRFPVMCPSHCNGKSHRATSCTRVFIMISWLHHALDTFNCDVDELSEKRFPSDGCRHSFTGRDHVTTLALGARRVLHAAGVFFAMRQTRSCCSASCVFLLLLLCTNLRLPPGIFLTRIFFLSTGQPPFFTAKNRTYCVRALLAVQSLLCGL